MARTTYQYDMTTVQVPDIERERYAKAAPFLARLKHYRRELDYQQWRALRKQALDGDVEGAEIKLLHILRDGEQSGKIKFATDRYQKKEAGG